MVTPSKLFTVGHAIGLGLLLRLGMAVWNGFWGPSFGAGPDAAGFHEGAVAYAAGSGSGDFYLSNIYMYALGMLYRWTAPSLFLGSFLSCAAWLVSALLMARMATMLSLNSAQQFKAMLLYALLPSAIVITSVTLREVYQLLAVNLVVYAALTIYINRSSWHWLLLLAGVAFMGALHGALLVAGLSITMTTFLLVFFGKQDLRSLIKLALMLLFLGLVAYAGSTLFLNVVFNSDAGIGASVQIRQESWQHSARASYSTGMRISSDADLLLFVPIALFHYLFQPMPWRASTALDWTLVLENLLRAFLLCRVVVGLYFFPLSGKMRVGLVFVAYLIVEIVWAVGTINWGTAVRHHIPAYGLLLLAAFAFSKKPAPCPVVSGRN